MGIISKLLGGKSDPSNQDTKPETTETTTQPKEKGGLKMKHQIEIKLPKFLDPMFDKFTPEEKSKFGKVALFCGGVALGLTVVYLKGYNNGMKKAVDSRGIYIIKGGE